MYVPSHMIIKQDSYKQASPLTLVERPVVSFYLLSDTLQTYLTMSFRHLSVGT